MKKPAGLESAEALNPYEGMDIFKAIEVALDKLHASKKEQLEHAKRVTGIHAKMDTMGIQDQRERNIVWNCLSNFSDKEVDSWINSKVVGRFGK